MIEVNKKAVYALLGISIMAGLVMGYYFRSESFKFFSPEQQKPTINTGTAEIIVDLDTPIVLETEYLRSQKIIISEFENRTDIVGLSLAEIRTKYTNANGYSISFNNGSLVIRQSIDDWSPEDKAKCRLKEYQDMVAIFNGPDPQHDTLMKVTAIHFSGLPANIKEAILDGEYEFENEAAVNDALENLDEYF